MYKSPRVDSVVRTRLKGWPNRPSGLGQRPHESWLRGRPDDLPSGQCFLKLPGSARLRTMSDGLWLNFGGTTGEPYVDIFAIEACSTVTNLRDKRSRFAPSTQSLLAVCPIAWLLAPAAAGDATPRWVATNVVRDAPTADLVLPVRSMRVMYGLRERHFQGFLTSVVPHAHEFYVPMDALTAEHGHKDPAMTSLLSRASMVANFFDRSHGG